MAVKFLSADISFKASGKKKKVVLVEELVRSEGFTPGDINIIFCSDNYLLELNQKFLKRDYFTDIITFSYNEGDEINGDLFVSIERIVENSRELLVTTENELLRVIIHGVLHLCGYTDLSYEEKALMRQKENFYLSRLS